MRLIWGFLIFILMSSSMLSAQSSYLGRPDLLSMVESCLNHTYNFSFEQARKDHQELKRITPDHPAPYFLEAIILYWENFPMTPDDSLSKPFVDLLDYSVDLAQSMQESEQTRLEGIFFDLFGRAFKAMFWADNGKSGKIIPDLGSMYNRTKEGFELKDQFSEFYFSTGLYNYYVEAYPEAHPGYKPLIAFMHDGDRKLGLEQLNYAIDHTYFLKVESLLFMTLIQLNYENNLEVASVFAERLFNAYPRNTYFQGLLVMILVHLHQFDRVDEVIGPSTSQEDDYSEMVQIMAGAYISEINGDFANAEKKYHFTIELADTIGHFADSYRGIGYMGLSRLHERKGLHNEARKYARKAADYTHYSFILGE